MDRIYDLPYTRRPHPSYTEAIPAHEMIKDSVTLMRGCFGGCTFCSITAHQGRIIQSRSPESVLRRSSQPGRRSRFQGHRQRHRRPHGQHVPDALHPARGRGELQTPVVRSSDHLQIARHRSRPLDRPLEESPRRAGHSQGAGRQRHSHGPGPALRRNISRNWRPTTSAAI